METFDATIAEGPRGGAYVPVPPDVVAALGGKGRIPVHATFDGVAYQGSVVSMGGEKVIGLQKAIQAEVGLRPEPEGGRRARRVRTRRACRPAWRA